MSAFYNEIDPYAAAWLRRLIAAGLIAPGVVDTRSIEDITPDELQGYKQVHFFAGIGVWSYALRSAGWPDDRPVWTGSCPCQPFSAAGKGKGFADERHLWPAFFHLIGQCKPGVIFGEQVASSYGLEWFDVVQNDLESANYASAAIDLCAAGFGAPHIRQRLYWVADAHDGNRAAFETIRPGRATAQPGGGNDRLANTGNAGSQGGLSGRADSERETFDGYVRRNSPDRRMGDADGAELKTREPFAIGAEPAADCVTQSSLRSGLDNAHGGKCECAEPGGNREAGSGSDGNGANVALPWESGGNVIPLLPQFADSLNGFWAGADWLYCKDGKFRPVESGTFPLVDGAPARVGRLRAYGNALVAPVAEGFIRSYMEASNDEYYKQQANA